MATDLATPTDPAADLVRLGVAHAAAIFVPVAVLLLFVLPWWAALLVALVVAVGVTAVRARGLDERVAGQLGARPVTAEDHPRFASLVEAMSMAVGVAPPRLHVIDEPATNAVVWGSGTRRASIAATTGLLDAVDRIELEAVVAHLLSGVRDGAVEAHTVTTALFGPLAGGPLRPVLARLTGATDDDRRIVLADLDGVRATQYPPGAVAALQRLASGSTFVTRSPAPMQPLWLAAPVEPAADDPFAVHPPLADRIDLLREV